MPWFNEDVPANRNEFPKYRSAVVPRNPHRLPKPMNQNNVYLEPKPRYEILDGLRGVAAMMVVAFHLFETYSAGPAHQILNHGYLAVDFFFVLSGFVIGYAYDDRWDKMSAWNFCKRRLIRLHPMVVFGSFLGLLLYYFGDCPTFAIIGQTEWYKPLILFLIGCTMIPVGASMDIRGWSETYPLNGPAWSLMLEYVGNILYALFIRRLPKIALAILVVLFAGMTIMLCLNVDPLGVLAPHHYAAFTVIGGWGIDACQLWVGFTRLLFPFFCGLLLARCRKFIRVKGAFWLCSLIMIAVLAMPRLGADPVAFTDSGVVFNAAEGMKNGIYEAICILIVFPLVVMMGAGSSIRGKKSFAFCKWLGDISFPLYITHFPLVYMQIAWKAAHEDAPLGTHISAGLGIWICAIMLAYASLKLYDEPVREWLKDKLFVRAPKKPE